MSGEGKSTNEGRRTCDKCQYPCVNNGEDLKPITVDELRKMGYILCEDYMEKFE